MQHRVWQQRVFDRGSFGGHIGGVDWLDRNVEIYAAGLTDQTDIIHITGISSGSHTLYCLIPLGASPPEVPACSCEMVGVL